MIKNDINKKTLLERGNIPQHIAIIMDGNGRWAKKRGLNRNFGHKKGATTLKEIVKKCQELGVKAVTAYAFSTENWKRPQLEVSFLMNLFDFYLTSEINTFIENNIKVIFSGDIENLPKTAYMKACKTIETTQNNDGLILNIAVNYGARAEIIRAVNKIIDDLSNNKIEKKIDESIFSQYLYTSTLPPVDLLIRPGGDMRISNFLLWQIAYTEIWFTDVFWPDFSEFELYQAIYDYQKRDRRFGAIK